MIKRFKFALPFVLGAMVLTGCSNSRELPLNITDADKEITTDWHDYSVPVTSVSFSDEEQSLTLNKGETHVYNPIVSPKDAVGASFTWQSNDEAVATVDAEGKLTAVGGGETTISVIYNEESLAELGVNVVVPLKGFTLDINSVDLDYNQEYNLLDHITFDPVDTTQTELTYSLSEGTVSVDNGVISTGNEPYNSTLTITSVALGSSQELNIVVSDHTNYASSVVINGVNELEINKMASLTAEVTPVDTTRPITHEGVLWDVKNKDNDVEPHAQIDEESGELQGLSAGEVTVTATSKDEKVTSTKDIVIYEVSATALHLDTDSINLTNLDKTYQLTVTFDTDRVGADEPSVNDLSFVSNNPNVASVNSLGYVTALLPGTATITVSSERYNLSDEATVNVEFTATSVSLTPSKTNAVVGDEITITATVNPSEATVSTFTFNVQGPADYEQNDRVLTLTPTDSENITVIATENNSGISSNPLTIKVSEPDFDNDGYYLVGSATFAGGESVADSPDSWSTARRALKFDYNKDLTKDDAIIGKEYKAEIRFNDGDQWLIRSQGDSWFKPTDSSGTYTQTLPFTDGSLGIDYPAGNVVVNKGGKFEIYFKLYTNGDPFEVYIKHADFVIEPTSLKIGVNDEATIKMSYWNGTTQPVPTCNPTGVVEILSIASDGTIAIKGLAAGTTVITATDSAGKEAHATITVAEGIHGAYKAVYLNANGEFDLDDVTMYAYSWNDSNNSDNKATQIVSKAKKTDLSEQELVYTVDIPENHDKVLFTRGPKDATSFSWDSIYEQSEDIALIDEIDMWTMTGRGTVNDKQVITGFVGTYNPDHDYKLVITSGYGLKFTNGDEYVGVENGLDLFGRKQFLIEDVKFKKDVEFFIYDFDNQNGFVGSIDDGSNSYVTIVNEKFVSSKDFTADVYLKLAYENNGIYIGPEKEEPDPENNFDASKYYVVGSTTFADGVAVASSDASWNDSTKAVGMTLNNDGIDTSVVENQYKATVTFNAGDEWRVRSYAYPQGVYVENKGAFTASPAQMTYPDNDFTEADKNITVAVAGKYDIYFKILKAGGYSIYVSPKVEEGGGDPEPVTKEFTITWEQDWVYNDENVVLCWAWGGTEAGEGKWYETVKVSNTSLTVTLPSDVTNFKFARFDKDTTTSTANWSNKNNESSEVTVGSGTNYSVNWA